MKTKATGTPGKQRPAATTTTSHQKTDSASHQSLKGKHIYLDLRAYNASAAFEAKLRFLGATIEKCFSRDINYVITCRGVSTDYTRHRAGTKPSLADGASSPAVPSPFSVYPRSGGATDSPRTDSPNGVVDGAHKPNYGSTDVLESARKWGMKIVHIDQAQSWITREYEKLPACVTQSLAKDKAKDKKKPFKVSRLHGNFIKFEVTTGQFRPVHQRFASMPTIALHSATATCPFAGPSTGGQHLLEPHAEGGGLLWRQTQSMAATETSAEVKVRANATNKRVRVSPRGAAAKGSDTTSSGNANKYANKYGKERRYGYCELCNVKYENLQKHLRNDRHREMMRDSAIFESLDRRIAMSPDLEQLTRDAISK